MKTSHIVVKKFENHMLTDCCALYEAVFSSEPWNDQLEPGQVETLFHHFFKYTTFLGYVAFYENQVVGVCIGYVKPWIDGLEYHCDSFYVDQKLQGKGIGATLLTEVKQFLKEERINGILLDTVKSFASYDFYKKNGFNEEEDIVLLNTEI